VGVSIDKSYYMQMSSEAVTTNRSEDKHVICHVRDYRNHILSLMFILFLMHYALLLFLFKHFPLKNVNFYC